MSTYSSTKYKGNFPFTSIIQLKTAPFLSMHKREQGRGGRESRSCHSTNSMLTQLRRWKKGRKKDGGGGIKENTVLRRGVWFWRMNELSQLDGARRSDPISPFAVHNPVSEESSWGLTSPLAWGRSTGWGPWAMGLHTSWS